MKGLILTYLKKINTTYTSKLVRTGLIHSRYLNPSEAGRKQIVLSKWIIWGRFNRT